MSSLFLLTLVPLPLCPFCPVLSFLYSMYFPCPVPPCPVPPLLCPVPSRPCPCTCFKVFTLSETHTHLLDCSLHTDLCSDYSLSTEFVIVIAAHLFFAPFALSFPPCTSQCTFHAPALSRPVPSLALVLKFLHFLKHIHTGDWFALRAP